MQTYRVSAVLQDLENQADSVPLSYLVEAGNQEIARWNAWMRFRHVISKDLSKDEREREKLP